MTKLVAIRTIEHAARRARLTNREKHEIHEAMETIDHKVESIKQLIAA